MRLNDYSALEKVLPSKIFEYGATNKPIIAGANGFSAKFIEENLTNYILFPSGDVESLVHQLKDFKLQFQDRKFFQEKFGRININKQMAMSIINGLSPFGKKEI